MGALLRCLILEDHSPDAELVIAKLCESGFDPQWKRVTQEPEFAAMLAEPWDVILADFALPQFNALRALELLRENGSQAPLIVVTGAVGEEVAVECIKQGAADYLLKDRLTRLASAVRQAMEQRRMREESAASHRALQASEQRFRSLIEFSSNGTLLLNPSGQVIHRYNDLFAGSEYECQNFLEWMVPEDRASVRQAWDGLEDTIQTFQFRISNQAGTLRCLEAICNNLTGLDGVQAIVVHYTDVTERRQLEEQFRQAQKMEAVGQLAAGLGHDFNNLLTIISGYSSLSIRHQNLPEPVQRGLHEIQDACQRATRLTRELLAFSRKRDTKPKVLDANRAISDIAPLLRSLLREDIGLKLDLGDSPGLMEVDEGELGQVIMNLVVNARDAMPGSGIVTIQTRPALVSEIPQVMLSVKDTGCGMSKEVQRRIFEPFFTTKDIGKGTGLGLSTVYAIVTNAGGQISIDSKTGEGSTFQVVFPRVEGSAAEEVIHYPASPQAAAKETILLVEDDDRVRDLIDAILQPLGYRILQARNAVEALGAWQSAGESIDLLLTDIRMPGLKGTELAQMLRKEQPGLKVLFISGHTGLEAGTEQESLGGAPLLAKPFSPEVLSQKVREVLGISQPRESAAAKSVLIVDDDGKIRNLLRAVLESEGYAVQDTADGKDALSRIKRNCPDIVVTDIVMPDIEGIELIKMMRKVTGDLGIIAMSGARDEYLEAARVLGANATIQKPIAIDALLALMRTVGRSPVSAAGPLPGTRNQPLDPADYKPVSVSRL